MSLLTPLGLLGLLGIVLLILIYIIKPNFQSKFVPSTFIWKLSLKYKKKKIPVSKLRNILIFICQAVILTIAAFIIAQPFIDNSKNVENGDTVMVIDTSASMHSVVNGSSRVKRAAEKALLDAEVAFEQGNKVSVIVAGDESYFLAQQVEPAQAKSVYDALGNIIAKPDTVYSYGAPDIDGSMKLAEKITSYTDRVTVTLYTDTEYYNSGEVEIYNVKDTSEWNASILDVRAKMVENYYRIEIDVASFGKDELVNLDLEIFGENGKESTMQISTEVYCSNDETSTVVLGHISEDMDEAEASLITKEIELVAYDKIVVKISENDSLTYDNEFYLYGGKKPVLNVLYSSELPNNFFPTALLVLKDSLKSDWDVQIYEAAVGEQITQGYDLYIYEHTVPNTLPDDGVVFCVNTQKIPSSSGIKISNVASSPNQKEVYMEAGDTHPLMNNIDATKICITQFLTVTDYDEYVPLMNIQNYPMLLVKDEADAKIVVMPFSLHYSNLAVLPEFPILLRNIVNYFFPTTVDKFVYETGDKIELDARSDKLYVFGEDMNLEFDKLPAEISVKKPGTVTLTQFPISGIPTIENIYVKIPDSESDISHTEEILVNPYFYSDSDTMNIDLLFYFAFAMVALLFIEWWLKSREQI